MFCTKCGAKIYNDNAEFCSVCGAALKQDSSYTQYESETQKINRVINQINGEKSVNQLFNDFMTDRQNYMSYNDDNPKQEEEWLNAEAINEIWNVPQSHHEIENSSDELLPDGTPEWLNEIKQEEEYQEYKSKFHLMEHPLICATLVAFLMVVISIISIIIIWNV